MLSLHHLEEGTFTLIEISVVKVLFLASYPPDKLVSEEHIARRDTCNFLSHRAESIGMNGFKIRVSE